MRYLITVGCSAGSGTVHGHREASIDRANIGCSVQMVSSEVGVLFGLDDNAIGASAIDSNRARIAGEHERWTSSKSALKIPTPVTLLPSEIGNVYIQPCHSSLSNPK